MERTLDDKLLEHVEMFGALKYDNERMATILDWPIAEVNAVMKDKAGKFYQTYYRGKLMAEYKLDKKLFEMALAGDAKAIEHFKGKKKKDEDDI